MQSQSRQAKEIPLEFHLCGRACLLLHPSSVLTGSDTHHFLDISGKKRTAGKIHHIRNFGNSQILVFQEDDQSFPDKSMDPFRSRNTVFCL